MGNNIEIKENTWKQDFEYSDFYKDRCKFMLQFINLDKVNSVMDTFLLFCNIFKKHFRENCFLIVILFVLLATCLHYSQYIFIQSLLGVFSAALVTVLFLDCTKQYILENKFKNVTQSVRNAIYSLYDLFCGLIFIFDTNGFTIEEKNELRNFSSVDSSDLLKLSNKLLSHCKEHKFCKKLASDENAEAYQYAHHMIEEIDTAIQNIKDTSGDIAIHEILYLLRKLRIKFENIDGKLNIKNMNNSVWVNVYLPQSNFFKSTLEIYCKILSELENSKLFTKLIYKRTHFFVCRSTYPKAGNPSTCNKS